MRRYPTVLTIAGSDSGGGAGIQADIKAISATGSYAASAITAVTVQNTLGVESVHSIPIETVSAQIASVLSDIGADAVKIGMLNNSDIVLAVRRQMLDFQISNIVLDPVMVSTSGHRLIEIDAIETLARELIPMARVITPNIPEAEILSNDKIATVKDMEKVARKLSLGGKVSVYLKAGHLAGNCAEDILYDAGNDRILKFTSPMFETKNTHGTGCTLSSAFASYLAQGLSLEEAAAKAKEYISNAVKYGAEYMIGHGHGPVNHFFMLNNK